MKYYAQIDDQPFEIDLIDEKRLSVDGEVLHFNVRQGSKPEHFSLIIDGRSHQVWIEEGERRQGGAPPTFRVHLRGFDYDVGVEDERSRRLRQFTNSESGSQELGQLIAPMPGMVVKLLVEPGQMVKKGDGVLIVEAMKMENEIRCPVSGEVKEILVSARQAVEKGEILAVIG
jgi:biotin carboxyl carrier protein